MNHATLGVLLALSLVGVAYSEEESFVGQVCQPDKGAGQCPAGQSCYSPAALARGE